MKIVKRTQILTELVTLDKEIDIENNCCEFLCDRYVLEELLGTNDIQKIKFYCKEFDENQNVVFTYKIKYTKEVL